ncbi:MAG: hypothetical protein AAF552_08710 [Pseudomonadota bacterium]
MSGDYGTGGRLGVGTPQGNPTVEPEMSILLPRNCCLHTVRLTSQAAEPGERLRQYLEQLPDYLTRFDVLSLDTFGFACTASSYLLGAERERELVDRCSERFPVVTATHAIGWALERLNARRIAIAAPYSATIREAAASYWTAAGFEVQQLVPIETATADTRSIYQLDSDDARAVLATLNFQELDAVLLTGTGLPSLRILAEDWPVPVLSSNLSLAAKMMSAAGLPAARAMKGVFIPGWTERLHEALAAP